MRLPDYVPVSADRLIEARRHCPALNRPEGGPPKRASGRRRGTTPVGAAPSPRFLVRLRQRYNQVRLKEELTFSCRSHTSAASLMSSFGALFWMTFLSRLSTTLKDRESGLSRWHITAADHVIGDNEVTANKSLQGDALTRAPEACRYALENDL